MRKRFFQRNAFLKFLMVLLAIMASTNTVWAVLYYKVRVVAVNTGTATSGRVYAGLSSHWQDNFPASSEWLLDYETDVLVRDAKTPDVELVATMGSGVDFLGWFLDPDCSQRVPPALSYQKEFNLSGDNAIPYIATTTSSTETAPTTTFYAKFAPTSTINWAEYAETPKADKEYYIYNIGYKGFVGRGSSGSSVQLRRTPSEALPITLNSGTTPQMSTVLDGEKMYLNQYGTSFQKTTTPASETLELWDGQYLIKLAYSNKYWNSYDYGGVTYGNKSTTSQYYRWIFIPVGKFDVLASVTSVAQNGSVTISESPTASATTYVKFNVSEVAKPSCFNINMTTDDASFVMGQPIMGNTLMVPVSYTAQNVHSGTTSPVSTATITVAPKNGGASKAGTMSAYVNLKPEFTMAVGELDWNHAGEEEKEPIYAGMEIAASQRTRLQNKLVYSTANAIAQNYATWTATIIGDDAAHFKFANGTQTVSGLYSADSLDVIYAPTESGDHTATLHIVVSYADAASTPNLSDTHDVTLKGHASAAPIIMFAKEGNQNPTATESHDFEEVIGTNTKQITANLFISSLITNPHVEEWLDEDHAFVFDPSSFDPDKVNQTLTFKAHREIAASEDTTHTATLTISGNSGAVTAILTLTYTAKPRIETTVTWNWGTIKENTTVSNPISTNSDGEWTLVQSMGDKITYNDEDITATAAFLHHEPGVTAEFVLHIPQTYTYTALDTAFDAIVAPAPTPQHVYINRQADLGDSKAKTEGPYGQVSKWASNWETWDDATKTLQVRGDNVWFYLNGRTKFEFDFAVDGSNSWTIEQLDKNGTSLQKLLGQAFTVGHNVLPISPQTATLLMKGNGKMSNIHFYEYDTIKTDINQIALVYNGSTISSKDITATFANKQKVTASLNETAAQYFTITATGKGDPTSSIVFDGEDGLGIALDVEKTLTVALKAEVNASDAKAAAASNACQLIFSDSYTYNHEVISVPITVVQPCRIYYKPSPDGTYKVTYQNEEQVVSSEIFEKNIESEDPEFYVVTLSLPTPAEGYTFQGWKVGSDIVSCKETFTTSIGINNVEVQAVFAQISHPYFKVGDVNFDDLTKAFAAAGTAGEDKVVTLVRDTTLDGTTTPLSYSIPAGVTFLVPHKENFFELQETPEIVVRTQEVLSAYRTLTLKGNVTLNCDGNICVSGKMLSDGGGNKSAYTTGECGVINMTHGGHIELNDGAQLFCWGYIKGQDMDQGNNTVGTGTVTANNGSVVWENFELGDWRGGSASLDIYNNNVLEHRKLFPFQSYAIQNIEVPTTYKLGSYLKNYTSITTGLGNHGAAFSMIGPENTMFLLTGDNPTVRKWYDPTTDLSCYELSGTAQLDALHITVYVSMSSEDFILPIANSMHIILSDCNMNLANPLMVQAGAIVEIKPTATVNLTNELYMYDKDQWGKYVHDYYFRSFNNLTSHRNRGAEDSKEGLDDAKFIVDGVFNINAGGKLYTTAGGANVMGNNGGVINFNTTLPEDTVLWAVTVKKELPYINWENNPVYAANLCNEDGSYTSSDRGGANGYTTFYNVHGRWFDEETKNGNEAKPDHTCDFSYLSDGNTGEEVWTSAVYSHDKTGLEARMKWFNVTMDENCLNYNPDPENIDDTSDWWKGTNPTAYYNYTMLNDWHQFLPAEGEGVYSCSNNTLYHKDGCGWTETGVVDENCLYTFDEAGTPVKKALVDGTFIPLTANGYDPAYHATANAGQYYICFTGCNWHPATPYTGESKAYTIEPETGVYMHYIWFNNDWLNVLRDEPFFYTEDEQTNVRTYYEYVNGDWVVATPYVSVIDDAEERYFYSLVEAFNVASLKKDATITLLHDFPNMTESLVYAKQHTTCTLDLNGHVISGSCANLLKINAPGSTFIITDSSTFKNGELRACPSANSRQTGYTVTAGTLKLVDGKMYASNAMEYQSEENAFVRIRGVQVASGATFTIEGGVFECVDEYNNYGIEVASLGIVNINGGHVYVHSTVSHSPIGIYLNRGTLNITGGTLECTAAGNDKAQAVYIETYASYNLDQDVASSSAGTMNISGGSIIAESPKNAYGVYVNRSVAVKSSTNNTIKADGKGVVNMTGGSITANAKTGTNARGIYSYGTVTISGGTISANVLSVNQSTAYGLYVCHGNVTISGTANIIANAPTKAYGVWVAADINGTYGYLHQGNVIINGGTITANATATTIADAIHVSGNKKNIASGNFAGDYAAAGIVTINGGTFYANATTSAATGVVVEATKVQNEVSASPTCAVNGGKFKMTGTSAVNAANTDATAENFQLTGGYYSHNGNLETYAVAPKHVAEMPNTDALYPDYKYELANAYLVKFMNGEEELQSSYQKENTTATYNGVEPTKENNKFIGWDSELALVTADATYTAQFEATTDYKVTFDAKTNGGNEIDRIVYVTPNAAVGTLPAATKTGHTLNGWFTAATAGAQISVETQITANITYYAQFAPNQHTLTWDANGGEFAEGDPSGSVQYGAVITAPVVTKTGYTFAGWDATPVAKMPDNDMTYTAQWTPNTNTAYVVKHYKQNLADEEYTEVTEDIQNFTATTDAYVTPKVLTYDGFISPKERTVQIAAAGNTVVTYNYVRRTYTITLDAKTNEGECATASVNVKHGGTAVLPAATKTGRVFEGWFTKAVGGDEITNETVIQYNIGTLYAQFSEANMNVTAPTIIDDPREVTDLRVTTTGALTITGSVTANNFILESNGSTASGQVMAGYEKLTYTHAYFDLKLNAKNHQWYAVAVPWPVNATSGVSVNGKTLELGKDFDIIYYNGEQRAQQGKQKCWSYVEDDGNKTLVPGRLYMIGLMSDAQTVRFEKTTGALSTTTTSVTAHASGEPTDAGWNGVANPALYHAFINPGTAFGQVYKPDSKSYETVMLNANKLVVGEGAFVQAPNTLPSIPAVTSNPFSAPRRTRAQANLIYDVRIAPAEGTYTDRLFIKTTDSKEADTYTVGEDLAKVGVSSIVPQMWINRYDAKLCVNTAELISETAEYPLGISVPANGEYTISNVNDNDDYTLYLTLNGEAIWDLSDAPYTLDLTKGTTNAYGLRISAKAPQVVTGVDEAVVDAKGETRKVLINDQVFIIRGNEVYTIDGQLVK